ncbi:MAG: RidA family protein [Nitrospinota bacterium]|nr:RidA family protein [Nitrospinota bacterium]
MSAHDQFFDDSIPNPTGPFLQVRQVGELLFISGQRGINPENNQLVEYDIEKRSRQTMLNLKSIVESNGGSMQDIVSTTVYVTDMKKIRPVINELYEEFFGKNFPTRTILEVSALNQEDIVEIEAIAHIPRKKM